MADTRLMIGVVGSPIGSELSIEIGALIGEFRRAQPVDRFRPRLFANSHELVADLVDRLLPGEPGPLAIHELHRVAQPAIAMHELAYSCALGAMRATIDRRIPAWLLADPHAVRDLRCDGAANRAVRADVLADGHLRAGGRRRTGLGLAHARKRQRAERCQRAGDEPRFAQEIAAIETAVGLAAERHRKSAAPSLPVSAFDQHGRLLSSDTG